MRTEPLLVQIISLIRLIQAEEKNQRFDWVLLKQVDLLDWVLPKQGTETRYRVSLGRKKKPRKVVFCRQKEGRLVFLLPSSKDKSDQVNYWAGGVEPAVGRLRFIQGEHETCTIKGFRHWSKTSERYTRYSEDQLLECSMLIVDFHHGSLNVVIC
ncbi:hypothetical protein MRB53_021789 [Persea americana]|uniref:Uncharacterized protein n=1 Tax=Persea americana TaxID=3435 RepID=A0ACC2L4R1_PERAE|nr:hypothetical protein MRB53_021789 [Persea americana]